MSGIKFYEQNCLVHLIAQQYDSPKVDFGGKNTGCKLINSICDLSVKDLELEKKIHRKTNRWTNVMQNITSI